MKTVTALPVKLCLLFSLLLLFAFVRKGDEPIDKLVSTLQRWTDSIPQEKVYLHMDKPYYALGDTIWFKGYLTIGSRHQLSALSGAVYVDLITEQDSLVKSLKLPVTSGMVMGDFILGDELKEGSYRIRAYTQWMRNAGPEYFYDHTFTVGDPANFKKKKDQKPTLLQTDVQFFPESGNLVNGIASRIAFKAVGVDGLGTAIKGKVVDEANNEVAAIETLHAGMGSFIFKPQVGKSYTANITFADNSTKTISLPKAADEGYVLSVYQPNKDSVLVRIHASANNLSSTINLIAHSSGETIFASPVKISSALTSIWLDKKSFPGGIAQFTLFNSSNEPLNERIAFIKGDDKMQLDIKTAKTAYGSKEHVLMDLEAKDSKGKPTFGNFSVSVIDESKVPVDESSESTIFSSILLSSDIKGYIEKPNYYFTAETEDVNKALDNLMLTQGYRRFTWKELNNTVNTKPAFPAEGLGTTISGKVTTLGSKPLPGANVILMSTKAGVTKGTTTDADGRFKFDNMFMTDSIKFAVQARTAKNSDKVIIAIDSIPQVKISTNKNAADVSVAKTYLAAAAQAGKAPRLTGLHVLKQVDIKSTKINGEQGITPQGMFKVPEESVDKIITIPDPENYATLTMALQARLPGISVETGDNGYKELVDMRPTDDPLHTKSGTKKNSGKEIGLIVNGKKILDELEVDEILEGSILPEDIAKIEIVRTNRAMVSFLHGSDEKTLERPEGFVGYVLLITKLGTTRKQYNPSIANITPKGFNKVREFYSPRYDRPGNANKLPDLRTTIYWNPYLKTDATGKTTFNFFNADGPGTYRVVVEGINAVGELGRQIFRYTVDGGQAASVSSASSLLATSADKGLSLITAPLDSLNKRLPVEKVYLHTDKPYYNIGDTLWFKSYLVDRVNLTGSRLSGLLYVELDNDSSEMVRRVSIPIKDGLGWGQIPLSKNIFHEGGYTLRAYTNWMQNFGEDYVFSQRFYLGVPAETAWLVKSNASINRVADKDQLQVELKLNRADKLLSPVAIKKVEVKIYDQSHYLYKEELQTGIDGSLKFSHELKDKADARRIRVQLTSLDQADNNKVVQVPLTINRNQKIDLQFLPEGGSLVAGLKSTVGFKAIGEDGRGTPIAGSIYDGKGNEVVAFAATHNGMGAFEFTPKTNETYTARISQPITKSFELPRIAPTGTVMHINNPEESNELKVTLAGLNALSTDSACYLIGTSRGMVYYSQKIELNQTEQKIDKKLFPTGIARFTFFKGKRPLNERAVFIDNHDPLSIKITPDKATYRKRDSVGLTIEVKDKSGIPVQGSFSLAVTDDSQVRPDSLNNNGIAASLLLNSELKGHVEAPGYYLNRKDKQAWQALDNLMLTQGWTGYDWKDVFGKPQTIAFKAEKEFKITGKVTNLLNKPVANAPVLISSQKPSFVTTVNTDENGIYTFKNLPTIDSGSFFLQASNSKGKKLTFGNVSVEKFKAPPVPETLKNPVLPWYVNADSTQINYVKRKAQMYNDANIKMTGRVLKEVKIKDHKIIPNSRNRNGTGNADLVFDEQDIKESTTLNLYELIKQKLPGLHVVYQEGLPTIKLNQYLVVIEIDGGGLPIQLDIPFTVEDLVSELSQYQIAQFKGMEVLYSTKYASDYAVGGVLPGPFKGTDIISSIEVLKGLGPLPGSSFKESNLVDGVFYKAKDTFQPGYLEKRANVLTNFGRDIAVILITTKNGSGYFKNRAPSVVTYRPLPIMYPQQFYNPKYNVAPSNVIVPDYRATLYWEPNISTDQNGKAKLSFYTSDINQGYTLNLQGLNIEGTMGSFFFNIK